MFSSDSIPGQEVRTGHLDGEDLSEEGQKASCADGISVTMLPTCRATCILDPLGIGHLKIK